MLYEGMIPKVFRRSIAFAIAIVVTSHSSSFEYTMSVHAVHAGAERILFVLLLYVPSQQLWSLRDGQFT